MKKWIFCLLLALVLGMVFAAPAQAAVRFPVMSSDFYVADEADVISLRTEGTIVLNNARLYEACDTQLVFVTVDTVGILSIEDYAYSLYNTWTIGGPSNRGVLVLMAIGDDDYWLTTGKGLEGYITAGDLDELARTYLEPYFARKDYDGGAKALFTALFDRCCDLFDVDMTVDEGLVDQWIESHSATAEPTATVKPSITVKPTATPRPVGAADSSGKKGGGFGTFLLIAAIAVILILLLRRRGSKQKTRRSARTVEVPTQDATYTQTRAGGSSDAAGRVISGLAGGLIGNALGRRSARQGSGYPQQPERPQRFTTPDPWRATPAPRQTTPTPRQTTPTGGGYSTRTNVPRTPSGSASSGNRSDLGSRNSMSGNRAGSWDSRGSGLRSSSGSSSRGSLGGSSGSSSSRSTLGGLRSSSGSSTRSSGSSARGTLGGLGSTFRSSSRSSFTGGFGKHSGGGGTTRGGGAGRRR